MNSDSVPILNDEVDCATSWNVCASIFNRCRVVLKFDRMVFDGKRIGRLIAARLILPLGYVLTSSCSVEPDLPMASAPFSVARKGNSVSVPFVVSSSASVDESYVLAFKYRSPKVGDPLQKFWSRPRGAHLFLKVKLVRILDRGEEQEVRVTSYDNEDGSVQAAAARGPGVVNVDIYGVRRDIVYMEAGHFRAPQYGAYRFDIEAVNDDEVFESISSWVTVEKDFSHYK